MTKPSFEFRQYRKKLAKDLKSEPDHDKRAEKLQETRATEPYKISKALHRSDRSLEPTREREFEKKIVEDFELVDINDQIPEEVRMYIDYQRLYFAHARKIEQHLADIIKIVPNNKDDEEVQSLKKKSMPRTPITRHELLNNLLEECQCARSSHRSIDAISAKKLQERVQKFIEYIDLPTMPDLLQKDLRQIIESLNTVVLGAIEVEQSMNEIMSYGEFRDATEIVLHELSNGRYSDNTAFVHVINAYGGRVGNDLAEERDTFDINENIYRDLWVDAGGGSKWFFNVGQTLCIIGPRNRRFQEKLEDWDSKDWNNQFKDYQWDGTTPVNLYSERTDRRRNQLALHCLLHKIPMQNFEATINHKLFEPLTWSDICEVVINLQKGTAWYYRDPVERG